MLDVGSNGKWKDLFFVPLEVLDIDMGLASLRCTCQPVHSVDDAHSCPVYENRREWTFCFQQQLYVLPFHTVLARRLRWQERCYWYAVERTTSS